LLNSIRAELALYCLLLSNIDNFNNLLIIIQSNPIIVRVLTIRKLTVRTLMVWIIAKRFNNLLESLWIIFDLLSPGYYLFKEEIQFFYAYNIINLIFYFKTPAKAAKEIKNMRIPIMTVAI